MFRSGSRSVTATAIDRISISINSNILGRLGHLQDQVNSIVLTPMRRHDIIPPEAFGPCNSYTESDFVNIMLTVNQIVERAAYYRNTDCTETHWMAKAVHPLLTLLIRLQKFRSVDKLAGLPTPQLRADDM